MIKGVEHHYTYYEKWFGSPVGLHMHPASRKVPTFVLDLNQNNTEALTTVHSEQIHMEGKTVSWVQEVCHTSCCL